MKTLLALSVWAYMVLAVIGEVGAFYYVSSLLTSTVVIITLATSQAMAVVLFYMQLKDEPGSLRLFALIPILFLSSLLIAMLASLG